MQCKIQHGLVQLSIGRNLIAWNTNEHMYHINAIVARTCFTLPTSVFYITCIHNLLLQLVHFLTASTTYCPCCKILPTR
jgi:hypothetical protein